MTARRIGCALALLALGVTARARGQSAALWIAFATEEWSRTEAAISGRVTAPDGAPLVGVRLAFRQRPAWRVTTDPDGRFTLYLPADTVPPGIATLVAELPGYSPAARRLTLGAGPQDADFVLRADPLGRDVEVAIGGVAAAPARLLPWAAVQVAGSALAEVPAATLAAGLEGRVAGLRAARPAPAPGGAPALQLRGATGIGASAAPLLLLDGTITTGSLADLAAEDIERIEVARGPAGAAGYGGDAGAGALNIITRRGRERGEGALAFTARNEIGSSRPLSPAPRSTATPFQVKLVAGGLREYLRDVDGRRILEPDGVADNAPPVVYDQDAELLRPGTWLTNHLAIEGRKGSRNFAASFQNTRAEGVVFGLAGFERQNVRLNFDQRLGRRVDLELSGAWTHSSDGDAFEGVGGAFFGWRFLEPSVDLTLDNPDGSPFAAGIPDRLGNAANPLYRLANQERTTTRSRLVAGADLRWRARDWLTAAAGWHLDHERRDFADLLPAGFLNSDGNAGPGLYSTESFTGHRFNAGVSLTGTGYFGGGRNTTRAGLSYEDRHGDLATRSADRPGAGATEFSTGLLLSGGHTAALYLENALDIGSALTLDALVRRESVTLLPAARFSPTWFRVAAGWRVMGELQARVAYGTAGLRSQFDPIVRATGAAPADVRLPQAAELEAGLHLGTGDGRATLDYTYSRRRTRNQLGLVTVTEPGGSSLVPRNIGTIESRTHELALGLEVLRGRALEWRITITGDRTRQELSEYLLPESLAAFGFEPATFRLAAGGSIGAMHGARSVRTLDELYDDPAKAALSGPGQLYDPEKFIVNEEGYVVLRSAWRTTAERPITYVTCPPGSGAGNCVPTSLVPIGHSAPDFLAGANSRWAWRGFALEGLLVWSQGGNIYNGTRQWAFAENRDPLFDQRGKPEQEKKPAAYYRAFFNGLNPHALFVEPGTWVKLRELSLSYTVGRQRLRKIGLGGMERLKLGVVGRNLATFTKYTGQDPEVASREGDPFLMRIDWFGYPGFRTLSGVIEIAF